jgi:gliding motility-associated-like protein
MSNRIKVSILAPDNPAPSVTISPSANGVYAGVLIKFTATPVNATGNLDYQWQVNGTNAGTDSPDFASSTLNNGDEVTCILSIRAGCTPSVVSQPLLMNILQPAAIHIPNAFTPNGDGINDRWDIPDLAYYPNCILNIYTRYGSVIYQSRGYSTAWDGSYNGKILPTGTYYYIIDLGNNSPKLAGYVALIK